MVIWTENPGLMIIYENFLILLMVPEKVWKINLEIHSKQLFLILRRSKPCSHILKFWCMTQLKNILKKLIIWTPKNPIVWNVAQISLLIQIMRYNQFHVNLHHWKYFKNLIDDHYTTSIRIYWVVRIFELPASYTVDVFILTVLKHVAQTRLLSSFLTPNSSVS